MVPNKIHSADRETDKVLSHSRGRETPQGNYITGRNTQNLKTNIAYQRQKVGKTKQNKNPKPEIRSWEKAIDANTIKIGHQQKLVQML